MAKNDKKKEKENLFSFLYDDGYSLFDGCDS